MSDTKTKYTQRQRELLGKMATTYPTVEVPPFNSVKQRPNLIINIYNKYRYETGLYMLEMWEQTLVNIILLCFLGFLFYSAWLGMSAFGSVLSVKLPVV